MYGWLELDKRSPHDGRHAFSQAQCGLCAHYGQAYRTRTRMLAATDPSLLLVMAEAISEAPFERTRVRCPLTLKLTKRRAFDPESSLVATIAELQLALAGEKLLDDRLDREGLLSRLAASFLERDLAAGRSRLGDHGFPVGQLQETLRRQRELESNPVSDLDALSSPTSEALGLVSGWLASSLSLGIEEVANCRRFGETLGRLLYMVDALYDLERDRIEQRFNPIDAALGHLSPRRMHFLSGLIEGLVTAHHDAFRRLPLHRHGETLESSLVLGLADKARSGLSRIERLYPLPLVPGVP